MKNHLESFGSASPAPSQERAETEYDKEKMVGFFEDVLTQLSTNLFNRIATEYDIENNKSVDDIIIGYIDEKVRAKTGGKHAVKKVREWKDEEGVGHYSELRGGVVANKLASEMIDEVRTRLEQQLNLEREEVGVSEEVDAVTPEVSGAVNNHLRVVDAGVEKTEKREIGAEQRKRDIEFFESVRGELSEFLVAHLMDEYAISNDRAAKMQVQVYMAKNFGKPDGVLNEVATIKKAIGKKDLSVQDKSVFMARFLVRHAGKIAGELNVGKRKNEENGEMRQVA